MVQRPGCRSRWSGAAPGRWPRRDHPVPTSDPHDPDANDEALLRATPDRRRLEGWVLVLLSLGMHPVWRRVHGAFALYVRRGEASRARAELAATDAEEAEARREGRPAPEPPATRHAVVGALSLGAALLAAFAVTGPGAPGSPWIAAGSSDATRVLHGEVWRAATALTLHGDLGHVASNVGLGAVAAWGVMRTSGVGWGLQLVLASGIAGNLANALAYQAEHSSIGFSTAVFGAFGLLGGQALVRRRRGWASRRAAWTGVAAVMALLALMGTAPDTDVLAHLFGALAGLGLGVAVRWRPLSWAGEALGGLTGAALVGGAWGLALR